MTFKTAERNRYFEDYTAGSVHEFGNIAVDEDEMIAFARRFDPQPFHTDPEAAKLSVFGGLIASGWFTAGLLMRALVDNYVSQVASLGSPGVDELLWLKPVRPGDTLSVRVTVLETQRLRSKPDRGFVRTFAEVFNQDGDAVMTVKSGGFVRRRDGSAPADVAITKR
ncbi:MAG: MaoC family dehydratase [Bacteroidetes bacterium]|nr:MaoC family dehydratase [Bacteroidota bacterium]